MTATTQTVVIGAGQAGLAMSRHLSEGGIDHVVLERGAAGERWRSQRPASLRLLTPNWLNALPGAPPLPDPDGYAGGREFAEHLDAYARGFGAPLVRRAEVHAVEPADDGYLVRTAAGRWRAPHVVLATGACHHVAVPAAAAASAPSGLRQLAATAYRGPDALPAGGVLVVGAGPTGQQLALELRRAGRPVVLAVGRHARSVRTYRGRDVFAWLDLLGNLREPADQVADVDAARRAPSLVVTGMRGGEPLDLGVLERAGVLVTGRLRGFAGARARFGTDRDAAVVDAERPLRALMRAVDDHVARHLPGTPAADRIAPLALAPAPSEVDLAAAGVTTILWATGYRRTYPWLRVPVLGRDGEIRQAGGITPAPGLMTLGLRLQRRRGSHLIGGVGDDAAVLAVAIAAARRAARRRRTAPRRGAIVPRPAAAVA